MSVLILFYLLFLVVALFNAINNAKKESEVGAKPETDETNEASDIHEQKTMSKIAHKKKASEQNDMEHSNSHKANIQNPSPAPSKKWSVLREDVNDNKLTMKVSNNILY